jgi:hypothetical protein
VIFLLEIKKYLVKVYMPQPRRYSDIGSRESFFGDVDEDGYIVEDNYEETKIF